MQTNPQNTNVATVGNGTLLAAALLGGFITRTGPVGNFTDTLDTSANIVAATGPGGGYNAQWALDYTNKTGSIATLAAGDANTTLTGASAAIPANSVATLTFSVNAAAGTVTVNVQYRNATN